MKFDVHTLYDKGKRVTDGFVFHDAHVTMTRSDGGTLAHVSCVDESGNHLHLYLRDAQVTLVDKDGMWIHGYESDDGSLYYQSVMVQWHTR